MKDLSEIRSGARVLLHTSILLYARWGVSPECRALIKRCQGKAVQGVITPFILADFCHRRMLQEAQATGFVHVPDDPAEEDVNALLDQMERTPAGGVQFRPATDLSGRPEIIRNLTIYADDTRALLSGELELASVHPEDFLEALFLQKMHGLVTTDSLNLAIARRLGINEIAAADHAFDSIQGLIIYRPKDFITRT
jgi:predicted nucleic acid-binding protein